MTALPDLEWPEDGVGRAEVLARAVAQFGTWAWVSFVPNPRPWDNSVAQLARDLGVDAQAVGNLVSFTVAGDQTARVFEVAFVFGAPEWTMAGFDNTPDAQTIAAAIASEDGAPARRLMYFDANVLRRMV
ncbi:MAG: hypothetical protein AAGL96_02595 [Pseudomonadota bacterium]